MVHQVSRTVKIPVIGMGGIMDCQDALEFLVAGASAVQVGTANFVNPRATIDIIDALESYCKEKSINRIGELVGSLRVPSAGPL
jgi:dihydroorotate dehydrogenase (NAD+) catalytic subunit